MLFRSAAGDFGNPQREQGDIVVRRRRIGRLSQIRQPPTKVMINYMLAVVIDDAQQSVNQIVRV